MDTACAADQSWPDRNYQFRRSWSPPEKRNPALAGTSNRAEFVISSETENTEIDRTVQRAIDFAMRRAARIDRVADLLLSIGRTDAAERLSHRAAEIRGVLA
jgi:hypothetical protein